MPRPRAGLQPEIPGLAARRIAVDILEGVLRRGRSLDEQLDGKQSHFGLSTLADRDRALVRRIIATALRRLGSLRQLLLAFLDRGFPPDAPRIETVLIVGATQILFLDVPNHAAVDLAVRLAQTDRRGGRHAGLVNAVLRKVTQSGAARLKELEASGDEFALDTPAWLMTRWVRTYGAEIARAIAAAHRAEPPLDLTVKSDPGALAVKLRGRVLPTGSVRAIAHGSVALLPGFVEGRWWVQDAAAALPARLLGNVAGLQVADLCAAPGGKTAQLALAGANVTSVDRSGPRLARLAENLDRLVLPATLVHADASEWHAGPFDAVLLDAPCSSTGTIRRHPDIPWLKTEADITALADLQRRLIERAVDLTKPGGALIFSTCSLEPEEGEQLIEALLARDPRVQRRPFAADEIPGLQGLLTPEGDLRTLPCYWPDPDPRMAGLDGFYAARLERA